MIIINVLCDTRHATAPSRRITFTSITYKNRTMAAPRIYRVHFFLTLAIGLLASASSAGGLFLSGLYRDPEVIQSAWTANDIITWMLVPILFITLKYVQRGELRAYYVWLGIMLYMVYNFSFYLFGAAFNWFFLLYTAIFCLSVYALIIGLLQAPVSGVTYNQISRMHRNLVCIFLIIIAIPLAIVEIRECVNFILRDMQPKIPTLIFALDLSMVIPNCVLAAILLWTRNPWGIALAIMMLVKAATYGLVLIAGVALIVYRGENLMDPLLPFYIFVSLGGLVLGSILFRDLHSPNIIQV